jgi:hypothetical protein
VTDDETTRFIRARLNRVIRWSFRPLSEEHITFEEYCRPKLTLVASAPNRTNPPKIAPTEEQTSG